MRARKRFGQHFLEPAWAARLVEAIAPADADRFLEIGPGTGALTLRLAPLVRRLTAVEVDRDLAAALAPRLPGNVDLVQGDFLEFDLAPLLHDGPLRIAGNLPYNVASPIVRKLVDAWRRYGLLRDATVMVQREVADRLEGRPGTADYGVLSIAVQRHADVRRLLTLPPGAFRPAPKVHSAVVRLSFRTPAVGLRDEALFERMVRSIFTQRRKTLANAMRPFAVVLGVDPGRALREAGIDPRRRPETLDLGELARLADACVLAAGQGS